MAGTILAVEGLPNFRASTVYVSESNEINSLEGGFSIEDIQDGAICYVKNIDAEYRWHADSVAAPAVPGVVLPFGQLLSKPGRWIMITGGGGTGPQGPQGAQGAQGVTGAQGVQGTQGVQGAQGSQGVQGAQGVQGSVGVQGPQGTAGPQGGKGSQGDQGAQGAQGVQGAQGAQAVQTIPRSFDAQIVLLPNIIDEGVSVAWDFSVLWPDMPDGQFAFRVTVLNLTNTDYCQHYTQEFGLSKSGGVIQQVRSYQQGVTPPWIEPERSPLTYPTFVTPTNGGVTFSVAGTMSILTKIWRTLLEPSFTDVYWAIQITAIAYSAAAPP